MVIISYSKLKEFISKHPDVEDVLNNWYRMVCQADWSNLSEVKSVYSSVDYVGNDRYVFDIRGNKYRLIALIHFDTRTVYLRFLGTHKEYDKLTKAKIQIV